MALTDPRRTGREPPAGRERPKASEHRHGGAKPPLQLARESMGFLSRGKAHLFDGFGRNGVGHRPSASHLSGCKDCDSSPA